MFNLTNLTTAPNQTTTAVLADGSSVTLNFLYRAAIQRWTVDVSYSKTGFILRGKIISTHANLLRLWRSGIPFGLQVSTPDGTDPFLASDLAPGANGAPARVTVTVLDATNGGTDVQAVEDQYFSAGSAAAY